MAKAFGRTQALSDANLTLRPGEVVGLLGANGAGKSTLSRIVSGHLRPSSGEIRFDGRPFVAASARDAIALGIAMVAQETSLAPDLSVLENIFLPDLATPGRLSFRTMRARAGAILQGLGHEHALPLDAEVRTLSAAQRQLVEIAKALALDARLVIFAGAATVTFAPGAAAGEVPLLGLGLRPEDATIARDAVAALHDLGPAYLVLHHDPRAMHGRETLGAMLDVARALGADAWLEAVLAHADDAGAAGEVAALGWLAGELGHPFGTVLLSPAADLKGTLPGSVWPEAPDAARLYDAARAAFPGARIGGGTFAYFTELNRKRPPTDSLDLVTFTSSPLVHAGDDRSVMESREAHPAVMASVAGIASGLPRAVGPSAIGVRDNPYGTSAKDNPRNLRQAMNGVDPRQRGLLGAAWALGYFADFATGGAVAIALGAGTGPFGAVDAPGEGPRPWFEAAGGAYPVFHVLRGLARLRGAPMLRLDLPASGPVCGLAARVADGTEIWVANTGPDPVALMLPGPARVAVLDAASFARFAATRDAMDHLRPVDDDLILDAFAVARIRTET